MVAFAVRLQHMMDKYQLTEVDLAVKIECDVEYISNMLNKRTRIEDSDLFAVFYRGIGMSMAESRKMIAKWKISYHMDANPDARDEIIAEYLAKQYKKLENSTIHISNISGSVIVGGQANQAKSN